MENGKYQIFYQQYDVAVRAGADEAMRAGLAHSAQMLPYALVPVVIGLGIAIIAGASFGRMVSIAMKVCLTLWLVAAATFIPVVRDTVIDDIPNSFATALNGGTRITAIQQFDVADQASAHFVSKILGQSTSLIQTMKYGPSASFARGAQMLMLDAIFGIWMAVRIVIAIILALMAFCLWLAVFDISRPAVLGLAQSIFALLMWQLAMSILIKIALAGSFVFIRMKLNEVHSLSLEEAVDKAWQIAGWFGMCLLMIIMVPTALGHYMSAAGSSLVAAGAMVNASRVMVSAGNSMSRAAHSMRRSAARR